MTAERLTLDACAPTPLASYLKALDVLRLLSSGASSVTDEPADAYVRGWWGGERFHLRTTLGRDGVTEFFLHRYAPSPVIAPWNGRAGFLEGEDGETSRREGAVLMRMIEHSEADRLLAMRSTVRLLRGNRHLSMFDQLRAESKRLAKEVKGLSGDAKRVCLERKRGVDARAKRVKGMLIPGLRSAIARGHAEYVDSCVAVNSEDRAAMAPLLGAGGLDGSRDFGVRFAAELGAVFDFHTGMPHSRTGADLSLSLFGHTARLSAKGSIGQFSPGDTGPNASTGYSGTNPLNPWDLILTMEGAIVFGGAITRQWGARAKGGAAFPFTFDAINAGAGGFSADDPHRPRGEIWTPLWTKPALFHEVRAVFSEGRLTIAGRTARNGLDAARAVSRLGASRGIKSFERYSLIQPGSSLPYQATPVGRHHAPQRPRLDLAGELERGGWLQSARRGSKKKTAPARARAAMARLEDALFATTEKGSGRRGSQHALLALGKFIEWLVSANEAFRKDIPPPPLLSRAWLRRADDGTPEFRVAAAMASLGIRSASATADGDQENAQPTGAPAPPMAAHLAPLTRTARDGFEARTFFQRRRLRKRRAWAEGGPPTVVWGHGRLVPNMIAVLERRLLEVPIRGLKEKPLGGAGLARLSDVTAFLNEDFDDARCSELLAGMVWARPTWFPKGAAEADNGVERLDVPFAYAALKPLFSTDAALASAGAIPGGATLPIPPGLVTRLRAAGPATGGASTDRAVNAAFSRARSSGLPSPFDPMRTGGRSSAEPTGRMGAGIRADRLAAALLIPVSGWGLASLLRQAYPTSVSEPTEPSEDPPDEV